MASIFFCGIELIIIKKILKKSLAKSVDGSFQGTGDVHQSNETELMLDVQCTPDVLHSCLDLVWFYQEKPD